MQGWRVSMEVRGISSLHDRELFGFVRGFAMKVLMVIITQDAHVHILSMGPEDPSAAYVFNLGHCGQGL